MFSPRGTHPGGFPGSGFCAWHNNWSTQYGDISVGNEPYMPDGNGGCGTNWLGGALDGFSIVVGHEYAEAVTDPKPNSGWVDTSGQENADKCSWIRTGQGAITAYPFSTGRFAVQSVYSNRIGGCETSVPVTPGNTVTVTNPGSQTGTVGTAARLQLHATDSDTSQTLTYTAAGLPAGLSISTTGLITGAPSTRAGYSVTVTARDSTGATGTATFTWTINGTGGGCTGRGQLLANPGFESGDTAWTASPGVIATPATWGQPAHGGTWAAWLDGVGAVHTDTLSQTVTIASDCTSASFSFWLHILTDETTTTQNYDLLTLTLTVNGNRLLTWTNLDHNSGYVQSTFNLSSYAGQTVTIRFVGTEDANDKTSFLIDDTALTAS